MKKKKKKARASTDWSRPPVPYQDNLKAHIGIKRKKIEKEEKKNRSISDTFFPSYHLRQYTAQAKTARRTTQQCTIIIEA